MNNLPDKGLVTWINHYTVLRCLKAGVQLDKFDAVGMDGVWLRRLSRSNLKHTSADFSLPEIFDRRPTTVGLVGGDLETSRKHFEAFARRFPLAKVLWSIPGAGDCLEFIEGELSTAENFPHVILVGMGAPLQEITALKIKELYLTKFPEFPVLVSTCGGWLDQLGIERYYPSWSTPLRLNWLVRLSREPIRLWKRYFIFPFIALVKRREILNYLRHVRRFLG